MALASMMQIGGWPLELAPYCCVTLSHDGDRLECWRAAVAPEGRDPQCGDNVEAAGTIESATMLASRLERGFSRADCVLDVGGAKLKLWLPRRAPVRRLWERALRRFEKDAVSEVETAAAASPWLEDVAAALADRALPPGWSSHVDRGSGSEYYFCEETRETTWARPSAPGARGACAPSAPARASLGTAWLLQRALGDEVDAFFRGDRREAPLVDGLLEEVKRCPLVPSNAWASVLDDLGRLVPALLRKAEALDVDARRATCETPRAERDARFHLLQAAAQPLFYLSGGGGGGGDAGDGGASYEDRVRTACRAAADSLRDGTVDLVDAFGAAETAGDLPVQVRAVLDAAKPLVLLRLGRALRPRTDRLRAARRSHETFPRRSIVAALRVGAFPSSPSFVRGLVELLVKRKLTRSGAETIAQSLARARLGLYGDDAYPSAEDLLCPAHARIIQECDDDELAHAGDVVAAYEEMERGAVLGFGARAAVDRRAAAEAYRRRGEALVAAYVTPAPHVLFARGREAPPIGTATRRTSISCARCTRCSGRPSRRF